MLQGRFCEANSLAPQGTGAQAAINHFFTAGIALLAQGPEPVIVRSFQTALAEIRLTGLPQVDRPYLLTARFLAISDNAGAARAMVARYRNEVTDTSLQRDQQAEAHETLGYIAIAEGKPLVALDEFRKDDIGWDGAPADECAPCLSLNLARAFDAAAMPDSALAGKHGQGPGELPGVY